MEFIELKKLYLIAKNVWDNMETGQSVSFYINNSNKEICATITPKD